MASNCFYCGRIKDEEESITSICPVCDISIGMSSGKELTSEHFRKTVENRKKHTQYQYSNDCVLGDPKMQEGMDMMEKIEYVLNKTEEPTTTIGDMGEYSIKKPKTKKQEKIEMFIKNTGLISFAHMVGVDEDGYQNWMLKGITPEGIIKIEAEK